ncbi:MAG: 3-hydroxyacyl-ACP dehydratase [Candidatus Aquicultor secundus]|uniref:3-hydroxyacyl-ACP dehydratase n=1 Tax=Candidatus Aquicultor secundus TaxID=1973895 RepID=A0A2M7TBH3_9ACTN|nr:acyl-CoA dehydratase activase [Candidatus Aquicultor secundus]NCO66802.1 3-hydroxyacyl-ACP dehydratase [Solirubrobacter sp.]OIO85521.1 MAG: 3-hydroxyacyl-ACP dehydratase [Candidatus Aquicultor secundus]PIU26130.1 MAG: 3-hydroxyacyl-ACP dehydratase [Candidatus Aquicultor secundus]PIW22675.1 MAG: 3-hydroxyacyl-ACP dehydratase [Candidatus Aquicultor secundus]PIX52939.1 MAG: 3-hydroxyacyl-ACP dehydratase [Candidatus Aquicultor secundus]
MYVGIDIGSRCIKVVALNGNGVEDFKVADTGFSPYERSLELIKPYGAKKIIATGYGRHFAREDFADGVITEIKAHAIGARHIFSGCRTIIDIGGQDSKVISLDEGGKVADFQMNDRCAAGTGKFLEIMAKTLGFTLEEFGAASLTAKKAVRVNSMCTVFAESEVVSLLAKKELPINIALGLHQSIIERVSSMLHKVGIVDEIVLSGGVGRNPCIRELFQQKLGHSVQVYEHPEIAGALGAALVARDAAN